MLIHCASHYCPCYHWDSTCSFNLVVCSYMPWNPWNPRHPGRSKVGVMLHHPSSRGRPNTYKYIYMNIFTCIFILVLTCILILILCLYYSIYNFIYTYLSVLYIYMLISIYIYIYCVFKKCAYALF